MSPDAPGSRITLHLEQFMTMTEGGFKTVRKEKKKKRNGLKHIYDKKGILYFQKMSFVFQDSGKSAESQVHMQRSSSNALSMHITDIQCVRISVEWERNPSKDIGKDLEEDTSTFDSPILFQMHGAYQRDTGSTPKNNEIQIVNEIRGLKGLDTGAVECNHGIVNHSDSDATTDDCSELSLTSSPLTGSLCNLCAFNDPLLTAQDVCQMKSLVFTSNKNNQVSDIGLAVVKSSEQLGHIHLSTNSQNDLPTNSSPRVSDVCESVESNQSVGSIVQSIDAFLPANGSMSSQPCTQHLTRRILQAMQAINALSLAQCPQWLSAKRSELAHGVKLRKRNALDGAGKLTLACKLMSLGVTQLQLVVDTAQAGGVCENADGINLSAKEFLEIKSSIAKARSDRALGPNARRQYTVEGLRFTDTWWQKLILVCREKNPTDWTDVAEYDACGFWLGVVSRRKCEVALAAAGKSANNVQNVVVSPWTLDMHILHKSWLSPLVEWIRFKDLTREWLKQHMDL